MSGSANFIPAEDAAIFAGVSIQTLTRFAEAGYLRVTESPDGGCHFSRRDLEQVFGRSSASSAPIQPTEASPHDETKSAVNKVEIPEAPLSEQIIPMANEPEAVEQQDPIPQADSPVGASAPDSAADFRIQRLEAEVVKFKHVIELQEQILDLRDNELTSLKEEREWLRRRIERYEEKSSRDQVLLLSETQAIAHLIHKQQRRSPVRAALEWLGVAKDEDPFDHEEAIEVHKTTPRAANE